MVQVSYGCLVMVMAKGVSPIKSEPDSGPIWSAWNDGFALIGEHKPSSRITVEPGWTLRTQDSAGSRPASKLPIRYFQRAANDQLEVEVPGIRTFDIGYNVDQDVATLTVKLTNNNLDPTYSSWASANGDFGRPGWLTPDRGDTVNRWGYEPNEWHGLLTRNALCRSFEGFGGQDMTIPEAVAAGHLVLTGVWLVDDAPVQTGQSLTLQCTNMAKLLVSQYVFGPLNGIDGLVPAGDYPMQRQRFFTTDVFSPGAIYGHLAVPPTFRILGIERTANGDGYWLVGTDGGIFSFGRSHFYGSTDSVGVTIPTSTYPNEGITSMARTSTGEGYWLVTNNGAVYSYGDAIYHGGLSSPAPGPIVGLESAAPHDGYWMVDDRGEVYAFGDAAYHGGSPPLVSGAKVVDLVAAPDGEGYWIVDDQGHVYAYNSATYHGGLAVPPSGGKVVGMAATNDGGGYWMTATDGGVFAFGNATFYGSIPGISPPVTLNDPVSDIVNAGTDKGYWLVAEDGGVFTFGADPGGPPFYGSLVGPSDFVFSVDGNYFDLVDIIHDLAAYAGFHLYDGGATDNIYGVLESTGIYADDTNGVSLDAVFFDKLTVIDPLHKIREIVSYLLTVDDEGGLQFHEANIWASGNYFLDHTHTDTIPVIDERVQLTDYTRSIPDKDLRSSIIISTDDPEAGTEGTITTSFVPATASELRGMIRPAMWVNELFATPEIQQTMAQLIALQIYFRSRLGSVTCLGNPMISVDDQVQILERETSETNTHYVRAHRRTHDHKTGSYLSQLTTNVLSPPGDWVVVKPDGSPTGSIVSNRTI